MHQVKFPLDGQCVPHPTTTNPLALPSAIITTFQSFNQAHPSANSYDVFVAPSGAVFEYGPATMRVKGKPTPCDRVAFVQHCRSHGVEAREHAVVCGVKVALW